MVGERKHMVYVVRKVPCNIQCFECLSGYYLGLAIPVPVEQKNEAAFEKL